jgi:phage internal scaffolding protein
MITITKPYDEKKRVILSIDPETSPEITEQCHKDSCDVIQIIDKHSRGLIVHVNTMTAQYGDYTEVNEYKEAQNLVLRAQEGFAALPSAVRNRFNNDPGQFLEFATNPENFDEMCDMGLAERSTPVTTTTSSDSEAENVVE